jgi:hypothetical protein
MPPLPLDVDAAHVAVIRAHVGNCRHAGKVEVTLPRASLEVLLRLLDRATGAVERETARQASEHSELGKLQAATTSQVDGKR